MINSLTFRRGVWILPSVQSGEEKYTRHDFQKVRSVSHAWKYETWVSGLHTTWNYLIQALRRGLFERLSYATKQSHYRAVKIPHTELQY